MINFLVSLIIASQLAIPLSGVVLGASTLDNDYPKRKITGSFEPIIEAKSAISVDMVTGKILFQKNGFEKRPIASITKLMTALVFLDQNPDWNKNVTITQDDKFNGGRVALLPGEMINLRDLFRVALIGSINNAADALARSTDLSYQEFIERMNSKAGELRMKQSVFVGATGIEPENRATAEDVAILLREALSNPLIREVLTTEKYDFYALSGKRHIIKNTNKLLESYLEIEGGKTGYIDEAGFCLVNLVKSEVAPKGIIVVILGASTKEQRFQENKFLSQWVFDNWEWE